MQSNVLPFFWNLASSSKDTRLGASADLVSSLENFQQSFRETKLSGTYGHDEDQEDDSGQSDEDESGEEVDDDDEEEENSVAKALDKRLAGDNSEDVVYSVKRLIRGLASSRESSRLGFSVALTELLFRVHTVTAPQILSLILRSCPHSNSMKGPEERDALFARLFGFTALIRSGCLFRSSSDADTINSTIDHLLELGELKGWLRESAWWSILALVEGARECQTDVRDTVTVHLQEKVYGDKYWSQEKIALTQILERQNPNLDWKNLLSPTFKHTPILSSGNLVALGRILKESDTSDEDEDGVPAASTGSWKPQLHFVWEGIFDSYFGSIPAPRQASFQDFFRVVVDESLFSNTSSPERKYWGFLVLSRTITLVPSSQISMLFTPNVMRSWINNLSSSERHLHKAALNLAQQVQNFVKSNPSLGYTLLSALIQRGRMDFDKVTKTKTVETIMGSMNVEGVKDYVAYLKGVITGSEKQNSSDETDIEQRRVWAIDQLHALIRNGSVPKRDDWVGDVLDIMLVHGFFAIRKANKKNDVTALHVAPDPPVAETTSAACRSRLLQSIVEITTAAIPAAGSNEDTASHQQGCNGSGQLWISKTLGCLRLLQKDTKHVSTLIEADEEIQSLRDQAMATLKEIEDAEADMEADVRRGIQILLSFCILRMYDEAEDALDLLEEVNSATRRFFSLPSVEASSSLSDGIDPAPIDELLDVLVALLDKGSSDLRNLANLVFGMISPAFTSSSIQHLVAQLERSTADGIADELEDEESVEEEDIDMAVDDNSDDVDSDEEATSESDDSDIEFEEDDADAVVDPEFRRRVAEALQVAGMLDDGTTQKRPRADEDVLENDEEGDDDGSSSEEELWDDDQMLKVDEQLAEVFRQRAGTARKGNLNNLHTQSQHFKHRILDFFDVFARKQPSNPLGLLTILPLLRLILNSSPTEIDLSNKAAGILRSRIGKAKHVPIPALTTIGILEQIHRLARKAPTADVSGLCSISSIYIFRSISSTNDKDAIERQEQAIEIYGETLKDYVQRKSSQIHPPFISDFIRRFPVAAFALFSQITESLDDGKGVKVYRLVQAYGMVQVFSQQLGLIVKSIPGDDLEKTLKSFIKASMALLSSVAGQAGDVEVQGWNAQRLKDVVKTLLHLCRSSKSTLSLEAFEWIWGVDELQSLLGTFRTGDKTSGMKGVLGLVEQMIGVVRGPQTGSKEKTKSSMKQSNGVNGVKVPVESVAEGSKLKKRKSEDGKEPKKKRKSVEGKDGKRTKRVTDV